MNKLLLVLALCTSTVYSAKILGVFMTPSYSHQVVYQPIWRELSLRGHEVTVITPDPLNDPRLTNLTEIDVSSSYKIFREENEANIVLEKSLFGEIVRFTKLYQRLFEYQLGHPEVQALLKNKNVTFDLLLVEYLYPGMYVLKDVYNCPMIGITSIGLTANGNEMIGNPKNPAIDPDMTMMVSVNESFKDRFISAIYDIFTRWSSIYIQMGKLEKIAAKFIDNEIRPLYQIYRDFSLVIVNSNLAIRNAKPTSPNVIEVSGLHLKAPKRLPEDLKRFLDNSTEGVIYFSLGSNMKSSLIPQEKLNDMMQVFSELPYKILWKFEKESLPNKPSNVEIRKWLPQQDLIRHPNIKLFITQGGIQSMDEALYGKVPMLIMPFFGDQHFNAHHMVSRGGALSIDYHTMTRGEFKKAILELMNNPKYKSHIDELSAIASDQIVPPLHKAVWWIEYVLRHDGAKHLMYNGRDVPFYQFYMLDILAALVFGTFAFFFILISITRSIVQLFRISNSYVQKAKGE